MAAQKEYWKSVYLSACYRQSVDNHFPLLRLKKKKKKLDFLRCIVTCSILQLIVRLNIDRNKTLLQDIFSASLSIHDIIYRQPIKQTNGTYLVELPNQSNPSKSILGNFLTFMKIPPLLTVNVFI